MQYSDYDWLMQVISQENYPLTKVSSASLRPSNIRFGLSIPLNLTKRATLASMSLRWWQSLYYSERWEKIIITIMVAVITTIPWTIIIIVHESIVLKESKRLSENDWSLTMKTSRRLMVNSFSYHLPSDGSIQPTDKLFHSPRGHGDLFCYGTIDIVPKRQPGEVEK